jgi:hypothetical protein
VLISLLDKSNKSFVDRSTDYWGCRKAFLGGTAGSGRRISFPHWVQPPMRGRPPGVSGGKASTTISSIQVVKSQEGQRYLYQVLGAVHGSSVGRFSGSSSLGGWFIDDLLKGQIRLDRTVSGMMNQLQGHGFSAVGTFEGVFSEGIEEGLGEGFSGPDTIAVGIGREPGGFNAFEFLSSFGVADVSMQAVVSDPLESFGQDMLDHASDEAEDVEGFLFDFPGLMIAVPVLNGLSVVAQDASDADGGADDVFGEVVGQSLSAGRDLSGLDVGDKPLGVGFPGPIDVLFDLGVGDDLPHHGEQVILPFSVDQLVGNVGDGLPFSVGVQSAGGDEDMKMGIMISGSSRGLEDDDRSEVQQGFAQGAEGINQTGVPGPHEVREEVGVSIEPESQFLRHGQDDVPIGDAAEQPPADEVHPSVGIDLSAGQTKAGLAGKGDASGFPASEAAELGKSHGIGIAAVEHLLDDLVVVSRGVSRVRGLEIFPAVPEDLFERFFVNMFRCDDHPFRRMIQTRGIRGKLKLGWRLS